MHQLLDHSVALSLALEREDQLRLALRQRQESVSRVLRRRHAVAPRHPLLQALGRMWAPVH